MPKHTRLDLVEKNRLSNPVVDDEFELDLRATVIHDQPLPMNGTNYGTCTCTCGIASYCNSGCVSCGGSCDATCLSTCSYNWGC
jgi:hypothetical protein